LTLGIKACNQNSTSNAETIIIFNSDFQRSIFNNTKYETRYQLIFCGKILLLFLLAAGFKSVESVSMHDSIVPGVDRAGCNHNKGKEGEKYYEVDRERVF
jgi:hypothetical protein